MSQRVTRSNEKRKQEYRDLIDLVETLQEKEETGVETAKTLDHILKEANKLFKESKQENRVNQTDEVLLDAKLIASSSSVLREVAHAIDVAVDSYEPTDFGKRIRKNYLSTSENFDYKNLQWSNLFEKSRELIKPSSSYAYLCGYLSTKPIVDEQPRNKKPRRREEKAEQVAKKQPEKLTTVNKEEDSVDDTVRFLQWVLNKEYEQNGKTPLNYFYFTINPHDFTHTIENMFHLSFLVRDGRIKLHKDQNGMCILSPVSSNESKKARQDELKYKQCLMSIDTELWQKAIQELKIQSCFLDKWKQKWENKKRND